MESERGSSCAIIQVRNTMFLVNFVLECGAWWICGLTVSMVVGLILRICVERERVPSSKYTTPCLWLEYGAWWICGLTVNHAAWLKG